MNSIKYSVVLLILTTQSLICMEPVQSAVRHYMLLTDEQPPKKFGVIPLELAKRCTTINDMLSDSDIQLTETPQEIIKNSRPDNIVHFISYIKKIDTLNKLPKENLTTKQKELSTVTKQALSSYIKTLTTPEIIQLFSTVDYFNVTDENNNEYLANEITDRIIQEPTNIEVFACLNNKPLFCTVVKKISKNINFEEKFIQPLADSLTERHSLPRTMSIPTCLYHNIRNTVTAPFRFFGYSWATKTVIRSRYYNTDTGTMITCFTQQLGTNNTITHLLITQENTNQSITVPLSNSNLSTITNIESNTAESVFICRSKDKTIVINVLDKEKPIVIDQEFISCVFSDKDNELYAIKEKQFGSFNIEKNEFTSLQNLKFKSFTNIQTNKAKKTIAVCLDRKEIWTWQKKENEATDFKKCNINTIISDKEPNPIVNMCLHPLKDIICIELQDTVSALKLFGKILFDINTQTTKDLASDRVPPRKGNCLLFLPDTPDILFSGHPTEDDYFFNIETNNFWRKKKNKSNERLININEKNVNQAYERFALTTDCKQSIEQRAEGSLFIDFIMLLVAKDEPLDFNTKKITAAPLISDEIIETVNNINNGFLSPAVISIAQNNSQTTPELVAQLKNLTPNMKKTIKAADASGQWKWRWMKNICYVLTLGTAGIIKAIINVTTDMNKSDRKIYKVDKADKNIAKLAFGIGAIVLGISAKVILERAIAQY